MLLLTSKKSDRSLNMNKKKNMARFACVFLSQLPKNCPKRNWLAAWSYFPFSPPCIPSLFSSFFLLHLSIDPTLLLFLSNRWLLALVQFKTVKDSLIQMRAEPKRYMCDRSSNSGQVRYAQCSLRTLFLSPPGSLTLSSAKIPPPFLPCLWHWTEYISRAVSPLFNKEVVYRSKRGIVLFKYLFKYHRDKWGLQKVCGRNHGGGFTRT